MEITKNKITYYLVDDKGFDLSCDLCAMDKNGKCNEKEILGKSYPHCLYGKHWEIKNKEDK